jgi:hypothetical protein
MQSARYYREQASRAWRLAGQVGDRDISESLAKMARDFDDIAIDLERGLIDIVHPALLPQRQHQ